MDIGLEIGDVLLCTVDRIVGTNVFVKIPIRDKEIEGYLVTSEIAPGRIRNLRDYVFPKKKIVCKVLRISGDRIELSLRRVKKQEEKEVKDKEKQEKSYERILKSIISNESLNILGDIKRTGSIYDFMQKAKENSEEIEKMFGKENAKKIIEILNSQKQKKSVLKKEIQLTTTNIRGIKDIKELLNQLKDIEIKYISAGKYSLKKESEDIKKADHELSEILSEMEKKAKIKEMDFSVQKK
ncbi:hypothetical protein K0A97_02345 [Patescibacteria group bacterium]|nr:hypothetical protein [Patescibacteria group bacterium]